MEDLTTDLTEFNAYLDSLLLKEKGLTVDIKDVSKLSRLKKAMSYLNILGKHSDGETKFVSETEAAEMKAVPGRISSQAKLAEFKKVELKEMLREHQGFFSQLHVS